MAQQYLKYLSLMFVYLSGLGLFAEPIRNKTKASLQELYEALEISGELKNTSLRKSLLQKKNIFPLTDVSGCSLVKTGNFDTIDYYGINCNGRTREGLISYPSQRTSQKVSIGNFLLHGEEKIGKKKFFKITVANSKKIQSNEQKYYNDTEFELNVNKPTLKQNSKPVIEKVTNANLSYFKSIVVDPNRRKEAPSNLEIFFDHTCPLKFFEIDQSFYWDNTISFVFEISCAKNTPYVFVRVPGNKQNKLVVSNKITNTPNKGDSFLAKLTLRKITNEQAFWEDFKIYYE
ncbi:MAG: hypothetical protein SH817_00200 [Leptospira sp.]|nr:hypothetical protein [Leptospira sp.]